VSLTGVKNPRSFTKAELLAMPQTEFTMALACATNGRGGSLVSNIPMSGVSVAYLIEQCGGLADGVNAVNATGYDGWQAFPPMNLEASTYTEDAYIALKYYGEDLSQDDGAPMTLVSLGNPGARQVKHVKSIDFTQDETFFEGPMMAESDEPSPSYPINGMWFQEDGVTTKVGEPVTLTGAVYSWNRVVGDLASVNFSFDMGKTWQDVKIADQVTDFDPFQWVTYSLDWTPSKAGKYQVKLQATDVNGVQMKKPVTLFVNVEE
ncbi:MAG: molybdopterin-dependent oxidoreductase, partial [Adlercreutzia sp.]|nr:molybdopterin-dependent oxidoreductase [Adlercreutzia sp.]